MALWGGHAHSAGPNLLASIFPFFFGFVFGMPGGALYSRKLVDWMTGCASRRIVDCMAVDANY